MTTTANTGDWVRIYMEILPAGERSQGIPKDTAVHPYEGWVNGWAAAEARIGEQLAVRTLSGRMVRGRLVEVHPAYGHGFGRPHPALSAVGPSLKKLLGEGRG